MRHIWIFAGAHKQAASFAREKGLTPLNWTFLYRADQLRGLRGRPFIRCGTWLEHPNREDIERMLVEREMIEAKDVCLKPSPSP
jgi:hypothetical protein